MFAQRYKNFTEVHEWVKSLEATNMDLGIMARDAEFSEVAHIVEDIEEQFGAFNDNECRDLKASLMSMEGPSHKPGRVRLADFYNASRHTHWRFTEKAEYLRDLGALDDSNATQPLVIVSNYIMARPNCLEASSLYAVCCRNECEDLMGSLERKIAAPTASPDYIAKLVTELSSDTVPAQRQLSDALRRRLHEIAAVNSGTVPVHGRLFAQWMHHAFPHECPYPHESGTINPQTADEWMKKNGHDSELASDAEMQTVLDSACKADSVPATELEIELPWSSAEELIGEHSPEPPAFPLMVCIFFTAALWSLFIFWYFKVRKGTRSRSILPLHHEVVETSASNEQIKKIVIIVLVCLLSLVGVAVHLIDKATFACEVIMLLVLMAVKAYMPEKSVKSVE